MTKMPWRVFLFFYFTGSAASTISYILLGYFFGRKWQRFEALLGSLAIYLILAAIALMVVGVMFRRLLICPRPFVGNPRGTTMPAIRRILVAVRALDAKSLPAVLKAAQIARACAAQIELYHGLDRPVYADLDGLEERSLLELERELKQRAVRRLEDIADRLRQHSIKVSVCADWDFPAHEAIVRRALSIEADLIVAAGHATRHRWPSLMRLTDWELVRLSPLPLLLAKNPRPYRHPVVLAAVDPTHAFAKPLQLDQQILQMGRAVSLALRGSLHAVHAYARVPSGSVPEAGFTPALIKRIEKDAERAASRGFDRVLRSSRITRAHRYLIARDPVNGIAEAARRSRSAIVVMGAVSRSGFKRLLIGNTAERILDELRCDVLVLKPRKFRNRVPSAARGPRLMGSMSTDSVGFY
ncbi:MAG TPA: universal stress protein [Steroidobacteraceae bacterium]|nr:universal stress protein [Steroidobacteraceae bacterium]